MTSTVIMTMTMLMGTPMFDYEFMRNAFLASTIVAVVAGAVGYFLVLRGETFAGHALAHVGFPGATGALLLGIQPVWGLTFFTVAAAIGIGLLGERSLRTTHQRDERSDHRRQGQVRANRRHCWRSSYHR